jgi:hypothetical protein
MLLDQFVFYDCQQHPSNFSTAQETLNLTGFGARRLILDHLLE